MSQRTFISTLVYVVAGLIAVAHGAAGGPPFNTTWFTSRTHSNLTTEGNVLTWGLESTDGASQMRDGVSMPLTKSTVEVIITNLDNPISLANVGDQISFNVRWLSTGTEKNICPSSYYADGKYCQEEETASCVSHTPECLSGTGDFRIAFFDTGSSHAGQVTADNFAPTLDYQVSPLANAASSYIAYEHQLD